jgi:hypothetical protein
MANTNPPHFSHNIFQNRAKPGKTGKALGGLRQDKRGSFTARRPTTEPARSATPQRADTLDTKSTRSPRGTGDQTRAVQLSIWVKPIVKAEIQRLVEQGHAPGTDREQDKLTVSSVAAALLERAVQGHVDMQYGALLEPVFQHLFDRRMASRDNRLALLLVRNYLVGEQTRGLATYLASRVPDMTPDILNDILDHTFQEAKKKLVRRSPELEELIQEVKRWVIEIDAEREKKQRQQGKEKP